MSSASGGFAAARSGGWTSSACGSFGLFSRGGAHDKTEIQAVFPLRGEIFEMNEKKRRKIGSRLCFELLLRESRCHDNHRADAVFCAVLKIDDNDGGSSAKSKKTYRVPPKVLWFSKPRPPKNLKKKLQQF